MRRVCVFTGTRAEYGLLHLPMRELAARTDVELQVLVSGAHLAPEFGLTYLQIEADGFVIDERVEMMLASDTAVGMAKSLGLATMGIAEALDRLRPDILLLLGDRYEALAAAQAALLARVPVAHLHGGEASEGAVDESIRHAITKMAHIHLTAAEPFRRRILRMGEDPDHVHVVGAPGIDNIARLELLGRSDLEMELKLELRSPTLLVTYHPATLDVEGGTAALSALFGALDGFEAASVMFTRPNADMGGRKIAAAIEAYVAARPGRAHVFTSLGTLRYLSLMREADAVVGNSSSGIIEAPAVGTPTVNLGSRQDGRLRAPSVLDCEEVMDTIRSAIDRVLSPEFQATVERMTSPYGDGHAAPRIARILGSIPLHGLLTKRFHEGEDDLDGSVDGLLGAGAPATGTGR